ncbi:MAG: hypothetical protein V4516_10485 [Pseudomonadota bacterium]
MSRDNLRRLLALSAMVQDLRLAALSQAEQARAASVAALARLSAPPPETDLDPIAAGRAQMTYERWADVRRAELKSTIARQTETCLAAQAEARTAFGRQQALISAADRLAATRKGL